MYCQTMHTNNHAIRTNAMSLCRQESSKNVAVVMIVRNTSLKPHLYTHHQTTTLPLLAKVRADDVLERVAIVLRERYETPSASPLQHAAEAIHVNVPGRATT